MLATLRRDPRASFHVTTPDGGAYAVAEGLLVLRLAVERVYGWRP